MSAPNICRLCIRRSYASKGLYDEHSQPNGLYEMIYEYFHPKIVDMEKAKHLTDICMKCFDHIQDFLCFQSSVISAQLKLIEEEKTGSTIVVQEYPYPNAQDKLLTIKEEVEEFIDMSPERHGLAMDSSPQMDEIESRNISQPNKEIKNENTSDDDLPLAQVFARRQAVSKTLLSDDATVSQKTYETVDNLLAKWIPNINCIKCHLTFPRWSLVRDHFKRQHPHNEFYITCCSRHFRTRIRIRDHLLLHEDPDIFKCDICGNNYTGIEGLREHKTQIHRHNHKFICNKCGKGCNTENGLATHYRNLHTSDEIERPKIELLADGRAVYICQLCGETKHSLGSFNAHRKKKHVTKSVFSCTVCGITTKSIRKFRQHEAAHQNKKIFKCAYCPRTYARVRSLLWHRKKRHPLESNTKFFTYITENPEDQIEEPTTMANSNCDSTMSGDNAILYPYKGADSIIASTSKVAVAEAMGKLVILNSEDFNPGVKTEPSDPRSEDAVSQEANENVSFEFGNTKTQISLPELEIMDVNSGSETASEDENVTAKKHTNQKRPTLAAGGNSKAERHLDRLLAQWMPEVKCSSCTESFSRWCLLKNHFKKEHPNGVLYVSCCSRRFTARDKIRDHLLQHGDPDIFNCQLCGNKYLSSQTLSMHKAEAHPEHHKSVCQICGKGFRSEKSLAIHDREMHNSDRPDRAKIHVLADGSTVYTCRLCGETKKTMAAFRSHRSLKHVKISKFVCNVCGEACTTARKLQKHEAGHQNKLYKCAFCDKTFKIMDTLILHRNKVHPLHCANKNYYININVPPKEQNRFNTLSMGVDSTMQDYGEDNIPSTSKGRAKDKPDDKTSQTYFNSEAKQMCLPELEIVDIKPDNDTDWEEAIPLTKFLTVKKQSNEKVGGHNNPHAFKCVYCDKCYISDRTLNIHLKQVHPTKHHKFACQTCGKRFRLKRYLWAHKTMCHRTRRMN